MDTTAILISQFQASLYMLRQAITLCPESLWNAPEERNKSWQVAYHAVYFAHEYLAETDDSFLPWVKHRNGSENFPATQAGEPYDKETVLEYLDFCRAHVAEQLPRLKLYEVEGRGDRSLITLELQIYSIRHLMQHTGELMERVGSRTGAEVD